MNHDYEADCAPVGHYTEDPTDNSSQEDSNEDNEASEPYDDFPSDEVIAIRVYALEYVSEIHKNAIYKPSLREVLDGANEVVNFLSKR